jgi:hypothetical protein
MACLDDPNVTPAIAARWEIALADAGLRDGQDAVLHMFDGVNEPTAPGGMAVEPGECAWDVAGTRFPFMAQQADRSFASRDVYEILAYSGFSERVQLALFRHELEHARQWRLSRFLLRASAAIEGGLLEHLPPLVARSLYIAMPTERAADAAGRRLAVSIFGLSPPSEAGRGHDVLLFGPDDAPDDAEINLRMLANLMFLPVYTADSAIARFKLQTDRGIALGVLADELCPGTGWDIARRLLEEEGFQAARRQLVDTLEHIRSEDAPATVREALRRLVLQAEAAAVDAVGIYALG